jgi:hypothetical protein
VTSYDAGAAAAKYSLDAGPFYAEIARIKAAYAQLRTLGGQAASGAQTVIPASAAPAGLKNVTPQLQSQAAAAQRAQRETLALAQAEARLMQAQGNLPGAIQRINTALATQTERTRGVIGAETQLARLESQRAGTGAGGAPILPRTIAGLSDTAATFASTAAGLAGAVGVAAVALRSFGEAFAFSAQIDATNRSIAAQLVGVRDYQRTYDEAQAYGERFKLTQGEIAGVLQASIPIMRASQASTGEIFGALQRLTILNPAENIQGAALALKELQSGDITSIVERFNVSRASANKMKAEIQGGADAVRVLDTYLQGVNATSATLSAQLDGPLGKLKEIARQQEELKLAQGQLAMGPGMAVTETWIDSLRAGTRLFTGDWKALTASIQQGIPTDPIVAWLYELAHADDALIRQADAHSRNAGAARANALAMQQATASTQQAAGASNADAQSKILAAAQADILKVRQNLLNQELDRAAASGEPVAAAAARIAAAYAGTEAPAIMNIIALLREKAALEGGAAIKPGYGGTAPGDVARSEAAAKAAQDRLLTERAIIQATGTTAQRLANVNQQLKIAGLTTEERRALLVQQATLTKQLADEQAAAADKAARAAAKNPALSADFRADLALEGTAQEKLIFLQQKKAELERRGKTSSLEYKQVLIELQKIEKSRQEEIAQAQQRIEERTRDHYRQLRQMQEDYELSSSRRTEDYQLDRQRLLAEGRIFEARQLEQRYSLEQRRAAEDAQRARARQGEDYGTDVAKTAREAGIVAGQAAAQARAAVPAVPAAAVAAQAGASQAAAVLAATAAQRPGPIQLQVQIAPTQIAIGAEQIVTVTWPLFEQLVDAELASGIASVSVTAPPGAGQGGGVSGPRP